MTRQIGWLIDFLIAMTALLEDGIEPGADRFCRQQFFVFPSFDAGIPIDDACREFDIEPVSPLIVSHVHNCLGINASIFHKYANA